jgi:hypothetical protein
MLTNQLISLSEDYYFKKVLMDNTVNLNISYPPFKFISPSLTPSYDQIDIINILIEKLSTFAFVNISTITGNNSQLTGYANYLVPSFNDMSNNAIAQLNNHFDMNFLQTQDMAIVLYVL